MKYDFDTFDHIKHYPLRTYNRAVMALNILEDNGKHAVEEYSKLLNDKDKVTTLMMLSYIKVNGHDAAKKMALKDFVPEDDGDDN